MPFKASLYSLEAHPHLHQIWMLAETNPKGATIPCKNYGEASSLRLQLYQYRTAYEFQTGGGRMWRDLMVRIIPTNPEYPQRDQKHTVKIQRNSIIAERMATGELTVYDPETGSPLTMEAAVDAYRKAALGKE